MYVLYVNKQEFSASSWRSNQGYTKMLHGQPTIKKCLPSVEHIIKYCFSSSCLLIVNTARQL